jgi:hypothetical protein
MRKGRIENWQEVEFFKQTRIYGNVYECDAFEEGEGMMTNELVKYHAVFGTTVAETRSGSMYTLGKPADTPRTLKEIFAEYADTEIKEPNHSRN